MKRHGSWRPARTSQPRQPDPERQGLPPLYTLHFTLYTVVPGLHSSLFTLHSSLLLPVSLAPPFFPFLSLLSPFPPSLSPSLSVPLALLSVRCFSSAAKPAAPQPSRVLRSPPEPPFQRCWGNLSRCTRLHPWLQAPGSLSQRGPEEERQNTSSPSYMIGPRAKIANGSVGA
ncbi:hypothetical protein BO71DRAFT_156451 [Aspergillus ellipticus CBS 707.79]|uniref:Uncharacterized protein n=1 Tax=Aspergillus ellipticus CBS 707.79 TaxID=1448320 RepID=A0A319CRI5_9EURO|nr:hypothetical protein BO71DRAFT_156451 [Aspergillus ellipticus CBS 707.79]